MWRVKILIGVGVDALTCDVLFVLVSEFFFSNFSWKELIEIDIGGRSRASVDGHHCSSIPYEVRFKLPELSES